MTDVCVCAEYSNTYLLDGLTNSRMSTQLSLPAKSLCAAPFGSFKLLYVCSALSPIVSYSDSVSFGIWSELCALLIFI